MLPLGTSIEMLLRALKSPNDLETFSATKSFSIKKVRSYKDIELQTMQNIN
jgi:hypothetical protein